MPQERLLPIVALEKRPSGATKEARGGLAPTLAFAILGPFDLAGRNSGIGSGATAAAIISDVTALSKGHRASRTRGLVTPAPLKEIAALGRLFGARRGPV